MLFCLPDELNFIIRSVGRCFTRSVADVTIIFHEDPQWIAFNSIFSKIQLAVDVEDKTLPTSNLTNLTNTFLQAVQMNSYRKTDYYTMASWIWNKRLVPAKLEAKKQMYCPVQCVGTGCGRRWYLAVYG